MVKAALEEQVVTANRVAVGVQIQSFLLIAKMVLGGVEEQVMVVPVVPLGVVAMVAMVDESYYRLARRKQGSGSILPI